MELIEECKDGEDNTVIYWLSKKPEDCEVGLKAVIEFDCASIELIEENEAGKQYNTIFISFDEFKNLQTIIEERK